MTADLTFEGSRGHYLGSRTINLLNGRFHATDFYSFISELLFPPSSLITSNKNHSKIEVATVKLKAKHFDSYSYLAKMNRNKLTMEVLLCILISF